LDIGLDTACIDALDVGFNAALVEVGVVEDTTTAGHWGSVIGYSVEVENIALAALLV